MTASDLVVTKPGGLSVSECLAKQQAHAAGVTHPRPGRAQRGLSTGGRRGHQGGGRGDAGIQAGRACWRIAAGCVPWVRRRAESPGPSGRGRHPADRGCHMSRPLFCLIALFALPVRCPGNPARDDPREHAQHQVGRAHSARGCAQPAPPHRHPVSQRAAHAAGLPAISRSSASAPSSTCAIFNDDEDEARGHRLCTLHRVKILTWRAGDDHVVEGHAHCCDRRRTVPFLIHCQHGADRTGLMSAMYRMLEENWTAQEALGRTRRRRLRLPQPVEEHPPLRARAPTCRDCAPLSNPSAIIRTPLPRLDRTVTDN